MGKYLKKFDTHAEYLAFTQTEDFVFPNVSHCIDNNDLHYNPLKTWKDKYLRTTALTNGTIAFSFVNNTDVLSISYSTDNGSTWTMVENDGENLGAEVPVTAGDSILWKGNGTYMSYYERGEGYFSCGFAQSECMFDVDGNIMSLLYGDNFANQTTLTTSNTFGGTFANSNVVNAENLILPATALTEACYATMFLNCTSLETTPVLPATTLASNCYDNMFNGCTSLTTAPELPATTLASYCYFYMFNGCTNLNYIKCLATDISAFGCTDEWVYGVAANGTFVGNGAVEGVWLRGTNGVPQNWTVEPTTDILITQL